MNVKEETIKKTNRGQLIAELLPFAGLIVVIVLFGILTKGQIFSKFNMKAIFNQSYLFVLGCLGSIFLFAQGGVDLSMGSVIALSSIFGAYAANAWGIIPCLLVCLLVGAAVGTVTGYLYSHTTIMVFILGLSMSFLIKGMLLQITGGSSAISIPYEDKKLFSPIWISIVVVIAAGILVYYLFEYTVLGKHSKAIGAGSVAAQQSGVNVTKMKWLAFIISGLTCGVVAFFSMIKTGAGGPTTGTSFEFNVMIAMILGGMPTEGGARSRVISCFIGAIMIAVYTNGMVMINVDSRLQEILKGIIFIVVVVATYRLQLKAEGKTKSSR